MQRALLVQPSVAACFVFFFLYQLCKILRLDVVYYSW